MLSWVLLTPLLASCLALNTNWGDAPTATRFLMDARSPYTYQADPRARTALDTSKYMLGEQFFKHEGPHEGPDPGFSFHGDREELDELPYSVVKDYGTYERRHYPAAKMVCTYDMVDTAADPLAGLEKANPWVLMQSKRSRKTPNSIMFMRLFRYISGVNQEQEEVAMTRPVVDMHKVVREDRVGNVEMQLMCFYLPSKYQEHSHPHTKDHHDHDGDHSHSHDEGHSHSHNEDHTHDTKPHSHGDDTKPHSHEEDNHSHSHGDDTKPHDDNHSHSHGDDTKPHNEDHTHPHGDDTKPHYEDHDHTHDTKPMGDSTKPAGRHAPHSPPLPMEGSRVVLYNRPALDVYVRQFGGWALTAATWEDHRQHLLDDLLGKRVKRGEFYTASYNSPMEMKNRRNEVMVQADPELAEIPQAYLLEQLIEQEESASLME